VRAEGPYVQLTASRDHRSSSTKYVHLSFLESRLYLVTKCIHRLARKARR